MYVQITHSQQVLFSRKNGDSGVEGPPDVLMPYLEEVGFAYVARDFYFHNSLLSAFVER